MARKLRDWILNNEFFSYKGQFSKSAFIMMSTWVVCMFKYIFSGLTFNISKIDRAWMIADKINLILPAQNVQWVIKFDTGDAMALLTLVFSLYFGGKFTPDAKSGAQIRDMNGEGK